MSLTTARAVQIPKYGQIETESRLFCAPFKHHLESSGDVVVRALPFHQHGRYMWAECVGSLLCSEKFFPL